MEIMLIKKQEFWAHPENHYSSELFLKKRAFYRVSFYAVHLQTYLLGRELAK